MEDFVLIIDSTTHRMSSMTTFDAPYEPEYFLLGEIGSFPTAC